jgi:hypothetical protein
MVNNLPEVRPWTSLLGISDIDIPLLGASTCGLPAVQGERGLPAVQGELGHLVPGVGGFSQVKKALYACARRKVKKS